MCIILGKNSLFNAEFIYTSGQDKKTTATSCGVFLFAANYQTIANCKPKKKQNGNIYAEQNLLHRVFTHCAWTKYRDFIVIR